jgi:photosystem II stability/assembly factor-like uncharacterized protein
MTTRLASLLALATLLAAPRARAAGSPVSLSEVRQSLFATCFATDRDGWMVGELGRIFHTTDGGATWERQDAGTKRPLLTVTCLDAQTAWVAGKEGILYATTDGGGHWTLESTGSNRHVFSLQFPTRERGHGVGDFGTMVHTEDGGKTWTLGQVPTDIQLPESAMDTGVDPGDVNLYGLSFGDPDHAWTVGEFGTIMASGDGGRTWKQQHGPVETTLFGVHFADAEHGWAVGIDSVILYTADGGANWRSQPAPLAQRSYYDVFVRGQQGWIVGSAGTVLKSMDGGATWLLEPMPIELAANWIRSVSLAPGGQGLAVGAEGLVFRLEGPSLRRLERGTAGRAS